jgi:hypothetical protein
MDKGFDYSRFFRSSSPFLDPIWGPVPGLNEKELREWQENQPSADSHWEEGMKKGKLFSLLLGAEGALQEGREEIARTRFRIITDRRESNSKYAGLEQDQKAVAMNYLGYFAEKDGNFSEAVSWYEKGNKRFHVHSAFNLVRVYIIQEEYDKAENLANLIDSEYPRWETQILLSEIALLKGNQDLSTQHMRSFVEIGTREVIEDELRSERDYPGISITHLEINIHESAEVDLTLQHYYSDFLEKYDASKWNFSRTLKESGLFPEMSVHVRVKLVQQNLNVH